MRLNTCVILHKCSLYKGGAEKQLMLLYQGLTERGVRVLILTTKVDPDLVAQYNAVSAIRNYRYFPGFLRAIIRLRKKSRLVIHSWDHKSSIYGFLASRMLACGFIDGSLRSAHSENMNYYKRFYRKYKLFSLLKVPIVSNTKAGLISYNLLGKSNNRVIYNGIDEVWDENCIALNDGFNFRVAMVANMRWKKDYATFIMAGRIVLGTFDDVVFYLIGDGENRGKYEDMIEQMGLGNKMRLTGSVPNPIAFIKQMTICVLCNNISGEGLSNSIMEYMLCKKPVIATDMGGNAEIVVHNETGFLIKENDAPELARRIIALLKSPDQAKWMGQNGYNRITSEFSLDRMVESYIATYSQT